MIYKTNWVRSGVGMSVAVICLMATAFGMQARHELSAQGDVTSISSLRLCYEAAQPGIKSGQQQVSDRFTSARRCGELAQYNAFDSWTSGTVASQAQRIPDGDCLAGRRSSRGSVHQSAFLHAGCEKALNGSLSQQAERYWF
ncbi:hypothetical protein [Pseudomonas profundi]|uniref:hypothetical protein n=1 Tax=Pseudomonas profundi TaxID=1981513 RepID=UPI00123A41F6|nr:hypothetical protein [Pseudomonas profundi]